MSKALVRFTAMSLSIALIMLTQAGCGGSVEGSVSGGGNVDGNGNFQGELKAEVKVKITWSPKPSEFYEVLALEMLDGLVIEDSVIPVKVSVSTDMRYTKTATFNLRRSTSLNFSALLRGTRVHTFVPENKAAVDAFIKQALANSKSLTNATISFNVKSTGRIPIVRGTPTALTPQNTGMRIQFLPNETPALVKSTVDVKLVKL